MRVALPCALVTVGWLLAAPSVAASGGLGAPDPNGSWLEFSPPFRQGHSCLYDPDGDRMIVIGGASTSPGASNAWAYSLESGSWSRLVDSGGPGPRVYASAVLDSPHHRVILFGGMGSSAFGPQYSDVWQMSLSGSPSWSPIVPAGPTPPARAWHTAVYDPVGERMIVIGGYQNLGDVWQLSLWGTPTWTEITPAGGPGSRISASAIYDPLRQRVVLFAGRTLSGSNQNDVWSLSLSGPPEWTRDFALGTPPAPRSGQSAIYDRDSDAMIIFGGNNSSTSFNDVWQFPLSGSPVWSQLTTSGTPPTARAFHSAIRDESRNRMVVFGGGSQSQGDQGVYALSLDAAHAWSAPAPVPTTPSSRTGHSLIYDAVQDRLILFGATITSALWQCSLQGDPAWSEIVGAGTSPPSRQNHAAVYDPVRNRMLVFGGNGLQFPGGLYNDLWSLGLGGAPAWQLLGTTSPPPARQGHAMIYDPVGDRLLVFGGAISGLSNNVQNDLWSMPLSGGSAFTWVPVTPTGIPPIPRMDAAGIYDPVRKRFIVYGGTDGTSMFDDAWALSLTGAPAWELLMPSGSPSQQSDQPAVYDPVRDRLVSLGKSGGVWDVRAMTFGEGGSWSRLSPTGDPGFASAGGAGVYDPVRDRVVTFGAFGPNNRSTWALTLGPSGVLAVGPTSSPSLRVRLAQRNPSRSGLRVAFDLASGAPARLDLFDMQGRRLRSLAVGPFNGGTVDLTPGESVPAGVYFVRLSQGSQSAFARAVILK